MVVGARSRNRTGTELPPRDFKSRTVHRNISHLTPFLIRNSHFSDAMQANNCEGSQIIAVQIQTP